MSQGERYIKQSHFILKHYGISKLVIWAIAKFTLQLFEKQNGKF